MTSSRLRRRRSSSLFPRRVFPQISAAKIGTLAFPDIGLALFDGVPGLSYEFLREYRTGVYRRPTRGFDVLISLKPRVTIASLDGVSRCARSAAAAWVTTTSISTRARARHCRLHHSGRGGSTRCRINRSLGSWPSRIVCLQKDRMVRQGRWAESTTSPGPRAARSCGRHDRAGQHRHRGGSAAACVRCRPISSPSIPFASAAARPSPWESNSFP